MGFLGGSSAKTSSAAPPQCPDLRESRRASSSTIPPRATFITRTPSLLLASVAALMRSVKRTTSRRSGGMKPWRAYKPMHSTGRYNKVQVGAGKAAAGRTLTSCLRYEGSVDRDVIRHRPNLLELHFGNSEFPGPFIGHHGVEPDHFHPIGLHSDGHFPTYTPQAKYRQCFPRQLEPGIEFTVPPTLPQGLCRLRYVPRQRRDQCARHLTGADAVSAWGAAAAANTERI